MKITLPLMATVCAAALAFAPDVRAQYSSDVAPPPPSPGPRYVYVPYVPGPLYAGVDVGGTLMQNMRVKNDNTTISFDPGSRVDLYFGFYAAEEVSLEFETGMIWNSVSHDNNQPLTTGQDADLYQVPLLINLVFHAPLPGGCQLYFGAGGGGVVSDLSLSSNNNHHRDYTDDSDTVLAYQAMAGFKWPVARHMEVGVGYKFMGTMDHTWFNDDPNLYTHTSAAYSHSILASFTFNF